MKKKKERDKKGQYAKGHKGGPGRKPGEPKDILCKDGKKRSVAALIDDLLDAYATLGGAKFLKSWASHSHKNLAAFVQLLFKFAPQPEIGDDREIKPLQVQITTTPTDSHIANMEKNIIELRDELREKSDELQRLKSIFDTHNITFEELEHEPIRNELPGHKDDKDKKPPGGSSRVN